MTAYSRILATIASYASIFGIYFTLAPINAAKTTLHWSALIVAIAASLFSVGSEIYRIYQEHSRTYRGGDKINAYMAKWVSKPGRTVIFSRDMSWADQPASKAALTDKARTGDLIILVHHKTAATEALKLEGAEVIEYGFCNHEPRSRFTVIGFGKDGSKVAIGQANGDEHKVYEFRWDEHPIAAVTEDLIRIIRGAAKDV